MAVHARVLAGKMISIGARDEAGELFVAELLELLGRDGAPGPESAGDHFGERPYVIDWMVPERMRTTATMFPGPRSYSHSSVSWHGT